MAEEVELEFRELEVVGVVREDVDVVEGAIEGTEDGGVVALEEALGLAAEADEVGPDLLDLRAEVRDVDGVGRDAGVDQLSQEGVDIPAWA